MENVENSLDKGSRGSHWGESSRKPGGESTCVGSTFSHILANLSGAFSAVDVVEDHVNVLLNDVQT